MKIKFGVIGANPQLRASFIYLNFPGEKAELAAVCDHDPEMVEVFRKTYPAVFSSLMKSFSIRHNINNHER